MVLIRLTPTVPETVVVWTHVLAGLVPAGAWDQLLTEASRPAPCAYVLIVAIADLTGC